MKKNSSIFDLTEGERINKAQQEKDESEKEELRDLLNRKSGRKFIFDIFNEGYIFTTTFTKSSQGYFNEGKREAALKQFNAILDLDPFIFAKMCEEFRNKGE